MYTYSWRNGTGKPGSSAQSVGEALAAIRDNDGRLEPEAVIVAAQNSRSALHPYFEWNDLIAAEKFRLHQARHLIASVKVTVNHTNREPMVVRAFVTASDNGQGPYFSTVEVMGDTEMRKKVLNRAFQELQGIKRKYKEYNELAGVFAAIDQLELEAGAA